MRHLDDKKKQKNKDEVFIDKASQNRKVLLPAIRHKILFIPVFVFGEIFIVVQLFSTSLL